MKYSKNISLGRDRTGKRIRKRIYGNSTTDLQRNITAYTRQYKEEIKTGLTFKKYSESWLETKSSRQAATRNMYETALNKTSDIDYLPLESITRQDLQKIINKNKEHPTACHQLELTLKQIFSMAIRDGLLSANPAEYLVLPKKKKNEERALTADEKEAIKKADLQPMDRMYVMLLYYFGLRPQEALALQPQDINQKSKTLTVQRAVGYDHNNPYIKDTKTYCQREIPIPSVFFDELIKYSSEYKKSEFLLNKDGKLMSKTVKSDMWLRIKKEIVKKLGADTNLRPYTFRHNYCCECHDRHLSILMTSKLMGNSPQMVMNVYTHLDQQKEPLDSLSHLSL